MGSIAVTGSASGIGAQVCRMLESEGHSIIGIDQKTDGKFTRIAADLSSKVGRQSAIDETQRLCDGQLDGIICCAGVGVTAPSASLIVGVNFFGVTELVDGLAPLLVESENASVVVIGSVAATHQQKETADLAQAMFDFDEQQANRLAEASGSTHLAYAASKFAVTAWARKLSVSIASKGIRVNVVAPGAVETPLHQASKDDPRFGEAVKNFVAPIGRNGQPEEIANAVSFLVSDRASFISGSVLFVDGGMDAMMRAKQF
ncbi:SDR family oxidoreductase (plasmid) [Vibrio alfacsensis]|uniref:SDR family oxidoreductase n=1 Tax=Vibrio alfacsensis TaxID=1074311 RepID=A0ABN5PKC9_9VIBR|nr:SDR family oxidoreductase [Vibrio alfacsensis]AXY03657.1 SDR family oxidoreductase [Vibrio alfacsensis]